MTKQVSKINPATEVAFVENMLDNFYQLMDMGVAIPADAPEVALDNFTRLKEGVNRFRLVGLPIYGAEVWFRRQRVNETTGEVETDDQGNPKREAQVVRYRPGTPIIVPAEFADGANRWEKDKPRRFLAMLVYNYDTHKVEVLTASQKSLFEAMMGILRVSDDNLNPFKADFKITKKHDRKALIDGKHMDIFQYTVSQSRETDPAAEVIDALTSLPFQPDLNALFAGEDPFTLHLTDYVEEENETADQSLGKAALDSAKKALKGA